jgi:hypothetical protein
LRIPLSSPLPRASGVFVRASSYGDELLPPPPPRDYKYFDIIQIPDINKR